MEEVWKDVVGYEGLYQVSNLGYVKRMEKIFFNMVQGKTEGKRNQGTYERTTVLKEKILKNLLNDKGYFHVGLTDSNGKLKKHRVHRLVAISFIHNPDNKPEVNHIDADKINNHVDNLEWVTGDENIAHALKNGLLTKPNHYKINKEDEKWIRDNYVKGCGDFGSLAMALKFGVRTNRISRIIRQVQ